MADIVFTTQGEFDTSFFGENNRIIFLYLLISLLIGFIAGEKNKTHVLPNNW